MKDDTPYQAVRSILGNRFIAYSASLARALGGVHEAIIMQQLMFWSERDADDEGWLCKTAAELQDETAIGRYQQEKARAALRNLGVIEESVRGLPARTHYRVVWDVLLSLQTFDKLVCRPSANSVADRPANKVADRRQPLSSNKETNKKKEKRDQLLKLLDEPLEPAPRKGIDRETMVKGPRR